MRDQSEVCKLMMKHEESEKTFQDFSLGEKYF